jgi:hypothetical protein
MMRPVLAVLLITPLCAQTPAQLEAREVSVASVMYQMSEKGVAVDA